MSESQGGPVHLRAVPGPATAVTDPASMGGLTLPQGRGGSRLVHEVIAEMGFLPAERVAQAVEEGRAKGVTPEQLLLDSTAITGDQLARATA